MYLFYALVTWLLLLPSVAFAEGESTDTGLLSGLTAWLLSYWNQFITNINNFVDSMWKLVTWFLKSLVLTFLDMLKDLILWIFDTFMGLAVFALSGLDDLMAEFTITEFVQELPDEVLNMMGLLGLAHCLGLIGIAITVRLLMQLIPFVRLGS